MSSPTIDPETIVLGTLMQATPAEARPILARLHYRDFADPRGQYVFDLMAALVTDNVPSLDPATVLGFADRIGAFRDTNHANLLTRWVFNAYSVTVPLVALDFHIARLIEHSYRRTVAANAARLAQLAESSTLAELDVHMTQFTAQLAEHRARITDPRPTGPSAIRPNRSAA